MKKIEFYQVDAFCDEVFSGNPAGVCVLDKPLDEVLMQKIALENNLSETAFFYLDGLSFQLRWFTPTAEVELCGHATLATAHVIFNELGYSQKSISFQTKSGELTVEKSGDGYLMNFPADPPKRTSSSLELFKGLDCEVIEVHQGKFDYLVLVESEEKVLQLRPNFHILKTLEVRGAVVTAEGENSDFVSRCFFPSLGIDEDPVTGSAHTMLACFWANRLHKNKLEAIQLSPRKGYITCELHEDRVLLSGKAITYLSGNITL